MLLKKSKLLKLFSCFTLGFGICGLVSPAITSCNKKNKEKEDDGITITLNKTDIDLNLADSKDNSFQLIAAITPIDKTDLPITWTSANPAIATVSAGLVLAVKPGKTKVTASVGKKSASCNVTVVQTDTNNYLVLDVAEDSAMCFWCDLTYSTVSPNLSYIDYDDYVSGKTNWTNLNRIDLPNGRPSKTNISLELIHGKRYLLRGDNLNGWLQYNSLSNTYIQGGNIAFLDGDVRLYGSIMSLIDNGRGIKASLADTNRCFSSLFRYSTGITRVDEIFSSVDQLGNGCFRTMFDSCTNLSEVKTNLLPWVELTEECFYHMFYGCTSLTTAPDLPAVSLVENCYRDMFNKCGVLNSIKLNNYMDGYYVDYFRSWADDVASNGTLYYKGSSTAQDFKLPSGWQVVNNF